MWSTKTTVRRESTSFVPPSQSSVVEAQIIMVALSSIKMDELLISWLGSDAIYENVMRIIEQQKESNIISSSSSSNMRHEMLWREEEGSSTAMTTTTSAPMMMVAVPREAVTVRIKHRSSRDDTNKLRSSRPSSEADRPTRHRQWQSMEKG